MGDATQYFTQTVDKYPEEYSTEEGGALSANASGQQNKPHFNLKTREKFVGSGWLSEGKFGKYIKLSVRETINAGEKVYLSPKKGFEGILG